MGGPVEVLQDIQLRTLGVDRQIIDTGGRVPEGQQVVQGHRLHRIAFTVTAAGGVHVAVGKAVDGGVGRDLGLVEHQRSSALDPDAALVDMTGAVLVQRRVPDARRFGQDTAPAQLVFQIPAVAELKAVGGAELDEVAVAGRAQLPGHPQVLQKLGAAAGQVGEAEVDEGESGVGGAGGLVTQAR